MSSLRLAVTAAALASAATPAIARHRHHHAPAQAYAHAPLPGYGYTYGGDWQAEAIARAAAENQAAPGVTNELAPDNKATATGGPVGGVPGFSGGR